MTEEPADPSSPAPQPSDSGSPAPQSVEPAPPATEQPAESGSPVPQIIGRFGLYATFVAAALFTIVIAGDLDVLVRRAPVVGWLALLVGMGPLAALLLSTLASYVNYYGVWRIVRGREEFDAGQDLKSHAADVPQTVQALLAGRSGCLPAASVVLLFFSLVLAVATILPPQMPFIGALGTWDGNPGALAPAASTATPAVASLPPAGLPDFPTPTSAATAKPKPTPTATPRPKPAATPRPAPTATPTPVPTATPTPTPPPPVIQFSISPTAASGMCDANNNPPGAVTVTLDNRGSNVDVSWNASAVENASSGGPWAKLSASSGDDPAGGTQPLTVTPNAGTCPPPNTTAVIYHVSIVTNNAGTFAFAYTVNPFILG